MKTGLHNSKLETRNLASRGPTLRRFPFFGFCSPPITNNQLRKFSRAGSRITNSAAFTLIEVTLAIAVVAIGLVGILALFPLGLRATRGAMDDTQMATIGQEVVARYQQMALNTNNYAVVLDPPNATNVLPASLSTNYTTLVESNVSYNVNVLVTNSGFSQITLAGNNLLSRVIIQVSRPGSKTNTYTTDVARYAK